MFGNNNIMCIIDRLILSIIIKACFKERKLQVNLGIIIINIIFTTIDWFTTIRSVSVYGSITGSSRLEPFEDLGGGISPLGFQMRWKKLIFIITFSSEDLQNDDLRKVCRFIYPIYPDLSDTIHSCHIKTTL